MNILTDEEIKEASETQWGSEIDYQHVAEIQFARAIEAAVIKRLAAGVSVEPYATLHHDDGYFTTKQREHDLRYSGPMRTEVVTLDQLTTAIAAARVQENERCVQACAAKSKEYLARSNRDQHSHGAGLGAAICVELLSALLGKEQS